MNQQRFKMVPGQEELDQIERDLRFYPAVNDDPQRLTVEQIERFNRDGFLAPLPLFSTNEIQEIRDYFDALLRDVLAAGGDSYSISTAHMKHGRVYDLLCHPALVDYVADLLGDNVVGWGSHFFCKMPGDGKSVAWHQDASYWPLTPSKTATVWLAIDDADVENGCVRFVPGSHHYGHLTFRPSDPAEHNVLNQTIEDIDQYGEPYNNVLQAGQISIHSDLLLHGSDANTSERRRCGLTLRYCAADVRAHLGWNEKGVLLRGSDPERYWGNPGRPDRE